MKLSWHHHPSLKSTLIVIGLQMERRNHRVFGRMPVVARCFIKTSVGSFHG